MPAPWARGRASATSGEKPASGHATAPLLPDGFQYCGPTSVQLGQFPTDGGVQEHRIAGVARATDSCRSVVTAVGVNTYRKGLVVSRLPRNRGGIHPAW